MSDEFPADPFEPEIPDFENFTGPHAAEILDLLHQYASAEADFKALATQASFRELGIAVEALDEERARAVLLRAIATYVAHLRGEGFPEWVEKQ